jgi:L-ascorbate metabolism protein UlaG (beta-lactamase superfamily)
MEIEAGERFHVGALEVEAVPAEHDGGRGPFGASGAAVGYVVTGSSTVYFAGDTDLFEGMGALGDIDVGLIPIWGWGPTLGRGGHLDPARAAEAARLVAPRVAIPIHWGTYSPIHLGLRGAPRFLELPPAEFVVAARELAPEVEVRVLQPGESFVFEEGESDR